MFMLYHLDITFDTSQLQFINFCGLYLENISKIPFLLALPAATLDRARIISLQDYCSSWSVYLLLPFPTYSQVLNTAARIHSVYMEAILRHSSARNSLFSYIRVKTRVF